MSSPPTRFRRPEPRRADPVGSGYNRALPPKAPRILALAFLAGVCRPRPCEPFQDRHGQPVVQATRATVPVSVDGRLGEDEWSHAPVAAEFVQREPSEGAAATEATELRLLYDDAALYVGVRLHDSAPGRIIRQLSRRDDVAEADSFSIFLDPHHDHLTGVEFQVSAAGVQRDAVIYDDNFESDAWDAVWESAVTVDAQGWVVEMRIPFSQLRFPATARPTWGVNARRVVRRKSEVSWLALVPSSESGLASRMAHLEGLRGIPPARHLELLPYASVREEHIAPPRAGNPFNDGSRPFGGAGLDLKYGLTSNMTLAGGHQPRLRPGRGRPGRGQPHRLRDLLRREAPLLHGGGAGLLALRAQRSQRLHDLLLSGAAALLLAPHRARAPGARRRRLRGHARFHDDPGRGQAHGADERTGGRSGWWRRSPAANRRDSRAAS